MGGKPFPKRAIIASLCRAPTACQVLCQVLGCGLPRCLDVSKRSLKVGCAGSVLPEFRGWWKQQEITRETESSFLIQRQKIALRLAWSEDWVGFRKNPRRPGRLASRKKSVSNGVGKSCTSGTPVTPGHPIPKLGPQSHRSL